MDWNALKIVLAIAETGSLQGAAKRLSVNHSTVFRRLNAFESEIGSRVFERLAQGYQLTATGDELLLKAKSISMAFDNLERHIIGKDIQPSGLVKVTAPNNLAYQYLPRYLASFQESYPEIRVELLVSNIELNMSSRQADIAVRATSSPPEHLIGKYISEIHWSVYAGDWYLQQYGRPLALDQLSEHQLIGACGAMQSLPAFMWLEKNLRELINMRCDDLVAMSHQAQAGLGLAFLPDDQRRDGLTRLFTFEPGRSSQLWLLTHPDLRNVERVRLLMKHLGDKFKEDSRLVSL